MKMIAHCIFTLAITDDLEHELMSQKPSSFTDKEVLTMAESQWQKARSGVFDKLLLHLCLQRRMRKMNEY